MKPVCVLVIDDNQNFLEMIERQLAPLKCIVATAQTIEAGVARMKEEPIPDILVLDLILPGKDEETSATYIKEFRAYNPKLCVIAISGSPRDKLDQITIGLGADLFRHKLEFGTQAKLFRAFKEVTEKRPDGFEQSLTFIERLDRALSEAESRVAQRMPPPILPSLPS